MNRIETLLTQMARVLVECAGQITELIELGFSSELKKYEQKLAELQRKLDRASERGVTAERARQLFLSAAELQSSIPTERCQYQYYVSAATEAEMWARTKDLEPELRAEARRAIKEYQKVRIPRANSVTLKKAHDVAEEWVSWAEEQTARLINQRFERKFQCRLPSKDRREQVAQAS